MLNTILNFPVFLWHVYYGFALTVARFLTSPFMVGTYVDMGKTIAVVTVLFMALMAHPRTRRVTISLIKFTNRHSPTWAKPVMVACAFFPGQADEIALVAILLIPILRNSRNRRALARILANQWNGR